VQHCGAAWRERALIHDGETAAVAPPTLDRQSSDAMIASILGDGAVDAIVLEAIWCLARGDARYTGELSELYREILRATRPTVQMSVVPDAPVPLTARELEVASLAAGGWTNKQIAARLGTSARTVGNQLQRVYDKLGIHDRAKLRAFFDD